MAKVTSAARLPGLVALGVVLFAFWPALFAGGSLVSDDFAALHPPFNSYLPIDFSYEPGQNDPINVRAWWGSLAEQVRSGEIGWWNDDLAAGQPTLKGGLPVFSLAYLIAPVWFAPGLVAALRTLTAIGLTYGLVRSLGMARVSALASGLAFGFSGFMVGWMNYPHSSVAALAPGLFWAIEALLRRPTASRAVPLGAVVAAMVWSNFPLVTIYVLLGAAAYTIIRLWSECRAGGFRRIKKSVGVGAVAVLLASLLAAPHLIGFSEYLGWAETSHRLADSGDSSAGPEYLLTAVAPAIWGSDAVGPAWFGDGNWTEFNFYAGASVVLLALLGLVAGMRDGDRRQRSVVLGVASMVALGVLVAFVGGPLGELTRHLTGAAGGLMTRAKVLGSLGLALGAALGVERLTRRKTDPHASSLRVDVAIASLVGLVLLAALAPSTAHWYAVARDNVLIEEIAAASINPLLAASAVLVVIAARLRGWMTGVAAGWTLVAIVAVELLSFAMPVPTIVDSQERLDATPAHDVVRELLDPGERLSGEGRTFYPDTTSLFGIDDARGQVLKSAGYQALFRAVDPSIVEPVHGRPATVPGIVEHTDVTSPVWDAMAVGLWAQLPDSRPPGTVVEPAAAAAAADPASAPLSALLSSPVGGLRAVLLTAASDVAAVMDVRITAAGRQSTERRSIMPDDAAEHSFAFPGEDLAVGTPVSVEVTSPSPQGGLLVGIDGAASLVAGMVAGDDELRLVRTGDVLLIERPHAEFVRLADAAHVEADTQRAAEAVAARPSGERSAVVDSDLGLPAVPAQDADLEVVSVAVGRDRVDAVVRADRAAVVVASVSGYPGWSATVDGRDAEIVTADAAFMGVAVPAGEHSVSLRFRPRHLGVSVALVSVGLAFAVWLLLVGRGRERRSTS